MPFDAIVRVSILTNPYCRQLVPLMRERVKVTWQNISTFSYLTVHVHNEWTYSRQQLHCLISMMHYCVARIVATEFPTKTTRYFASHLLLLLEETIDGSVLTSFNDVLYLISCFQTNALVYYIFSYSSTCFESYCAHHREDPLYIHNIWFFMCHSSCVTVRCTGS